MPKYPEPLREIKVVVFRLGVGGADVQKCVVVPMIGREVAIGCGDCGGVAGHHVTEQCPPVPALGVDEREPLPDHAGHVECGVDAGVVFRSHPFGTGGAVGGMEAFGAAEGGDLGLFDGWWGRREGAVDDELSIVE